MYPGADLLDFISEVSGLIFRFHSEVSGLKDISSAIVSSDRAVGGSEP